MDLRHYPSDLIYMLTKHHITATGDMRFDRQLVNKAERTEQTLREIHQDLIKEELMRRASFIDITDPGVYTAHANLVVAIANNLLASQHRKFEIDEYNQKIIKFLLLYFHNSPNAEDVFPDRGYKIHKNIMLVGPAGVGKTFLMQVFSDYTRRFSLPRAFYNVQITQMLEYYSIHNNLDLYAYNMESKRSFDGNPYSLCLNDLGLKDKMHYGMSTLVVVEQFLHARNEIWSKEHVLTHITTNLNEDELSEKFFDDHNVYVDRFKTYNVIPLEGDSRR